MTMNQVEIILTDECEVFFRTTVIASTDAALQQILAGMNKRRDDAMATGAKWRQAILNVPDAGDHGRLPHSLATLHLRGRDGIATW